MYNTLGKRFPSIVYSQDTVIEKDYDQGYSRRGRGVAGNGIEGLDGARR